MRRYLIHALLIVVGVGVSLLVLTREPPGNPRGPAGGRPNVPVTPWTPSAEHDAEANADFGVDSDRDDLVPLAGSRAGADWPQFNGALRDNRSTETGLLPSWPAEGPPLAWTAKGLGTGFSSVSVADGAVYTMGNKGASEAVIALDAGTGEKIWSTPMAWASRLSAGDGPRSTPSVGGGSVYALGGNGDLACLDAKTGALRWRKNVLEEYGARVPGFGVCESVLIDGDRLICTPGGEKATLVALDRETGEPIWKSLLPDKDGAGYASAAVAEIAGVRQYVQFTAAGTVGVRAEDGAFLWRENSAANPNANCSSPLVSGDLVFSASGYGKGGALVRVTAAGTRAELVYHTGEMKSHHGDMVIVDGLLFGSDDPGILTCLDLESGKVRWQNRSVGKGAVTFAEGRIYLRGEQGAVALVEATGEAYRELGRFDQPARSGGQAWPHPVVAAGRLFLRDQDLLLCYDLRASP